jgi:hypothetical protein
VGKNLSARLAGKRERVGEGEEVGPVGEGKRGWRDSGEEEERERAREGEKDRRREGG